MRTNRMSLSESRLLAVKNAVGKTEITLIMEVKCMGDSLLHH